MKRIAAFVVGLSVAVVLMQAATAAGRPTCLVSNERTGVGLRSLQDAVDAASDGDTLVIKGTCDSEESIVLIMKSLRLEGVSNPAFGTATVTATYDVLVILGDVTVVIDRLTVHAGYGAFSGAGVYTDFGTVTLNRSTVTGGGAAEGGGIYNYSGTVVLNGQASPATSPPMGAASSTSSARSRSTTRRSVEIAPGTGSSGRGLTTAAVSTRIAAPSRVTTPRSVATAPTTREVASSTRAPP